MDIEFHYYINYLIAIKAGFSKEEAYKIAYSAQFIDDNTEQITILDDSNSAYQSIITQNYSPFLDQEQMLKTYLCFHFIPGEMNEVYAIRKDNASHPLATTPSSFLARKILNYACSTRSLYALGIASHAFADTWAHANFTGTNDTFNKSGQLLSYFIPHIGHADFFDKPDKINLIWHDDRLLNPEVDNKRKFITAARVLLSEYQKAFFPSSVLVDKAINEFENDILNAVGNNGQYNFSERINNYQILANKLSNKNIPRYCKNYWRQRAYFKTATCYRWHKNYFSSDWYLFQQEAKAYQKYAWSLIEKRVNFSKKFDTNLDDQQNQRIHIH